jgi:hypothetical protein
MGQKWKGKMIEIMICFCVLQTTLVTLKLIGFIPWSWVMVLSPLWGSLVIGLSVIVFLLLVLAVKIAKRVKKY